MNPLWPIVVTGVLAGFPAILAALLSYRSSTHSKNNAAAIQEIHVQMNGELAKRIAVEVKAAFAEGVKSETDKKP
jgi:hypothetical protein